MFYISKKSLLLHFQLNPTVGDHFYFCFVLPPGSGFASSVRLQEVFRNADPDPKHCSGEEEKPPPPLVSQRNKSCTNFLLLLAD